MRFPSSFMLSSSSSSSSWTMAATLLVATVSAVLPSVNAADICFAIDVSSTVCSPPGSQSSCWMCLNECHIPSTLSTDTCCEDFQYQIEYARMIATEAAESDPSSKFALVTFHGAVVENSGDFVDLATFNSAIDTAKYYGGWRNTGGAMNKCLEYLQSSSSSSNNKSIVLMTDGMPSAGAPGQSPGGWIPAHRDYAKDQTTAALGAGIDVIPVIIGATSSDAAYLVTLATDTNNGVLLFSGQSDLQDPYDVLDILEIGPPSTASEDSDVAMCFAVDMGGGICSPSGAASSCWNCLSVCRDVSLTQDVCCPSFDNELEYVRQVATDISTKHPSATFGFVTFHKFAVGQTNDELVNIDALNRAIDATRYYGGWRNLGGGIKMCRDLLSESTATNKFIVSMSDGQPTYGDVTVTTGFLQQHATYACDQATAATNEGVTMLPILIGTNNPGDYSLSCLSDSIITLTDLSQLDDPSLITEEVSIIEDETDPTDPTDIPKTSLNAADSICGKSFSGDETFSIDVASGIVDCSAANLDGSVEAVLVLSGNAVLDCNGAAILGNGDNIGVRVTDSASIVNCEFSGFESGIYLDASTGDRTISNTKISNNKVHGIYVKDSAGEVNIRDVVIEDNIYYGILFDGVTTGSNTVEGATIRRNSQGIMIKRKVTGDISVIDSIFDDNDFHGMVIQSKESVEVRGGEFINNVRHGILATRFGANGPLLISGIKAKENHESGIVLSGTQQVTVENSDISDNEKDGIYTRNSNVDVSCSEVSRNKRNGVFNDSTNNSNTVHIMNSRTDNNAVDNLMTEQGTDMTLTYVRACGGNINVATSNVSGVTCDNGSCGSTCGASTFDVSGTCTAFPPSTV